MKTKGEHWFEWEREATIHPIMMCMEAWMEPMKKAYGKSWPTTIIIYNNDIVSWHNTWQDLLEYGDYLITKFASPNERNKIMEDIKSQAKKLDKMFEKFKGLKLDILSDNEMLVVYEELHSCYTEWFIPGGLVEPIGHKGEKILMNILPSMPDKEKNEAFALITTTTKKSFSKRELHDLLNIAVAKKNGRYSHRLLEEHAKKYFWIHNNYFTTEMLDIKFFQNELNLVMEKYPKPEVQINKLEKELEEVNERKKQLIEKFNFNESERNVIELLDIFAWYQDYRKEYTMQMLHYLDKILSEIGKRKGFTLKEMKYTLAAEIPKIIIDTFERKIINERMNRYLFYFEGKSGLVEEGSGEWSIRKEREIFNAMKIDDEVLEINGMIANKGFVRGKARVTMSSEEAKKIKDGEILITSMTTPDFVTAIKKASGIVTNEGGILSHAAVISREFGIPCIVGTKLATKVFKTGDLIEVDCELGVVRKIKEQ